MLNLRRLLLGRRLASDETEASKIGNFVGLAVFSSDALSSVAYATQEIMASLSASGVVLGAAGAAWLLGLSIPVACGIVLLLLILGTSYRQTIRAYPGGGGAYIVAKENLGELAAQTAGAALLTDYILTVAASVSSGVAAITSALPWLQGHNVLLTILAIVFVAAANLRGVKESGSFFSIPTYGFVGCILLLLLTGVWRWATGTSLPAPNLEQVGQELHRTQMVSGAALIWIFMRAYSAGCTALTGVEAISNGVTAFREPSARNAAKTMIWMILLLGTMFLGITLLSHHFGVTYHHSADPSVVGETLLSKLAKAVYGDVSSGLPRLIYLITQSCTFAILVVAANTAYADFPRLAALQARDGFLPKQFAIQGDRLVFSNGIIILTVVSCALVWLLNANTDLLLPLYALGVFIGFTLSQAGMVIHWLRLRNKARHWHTKAFINGLGAITSGIVMLDIGITKFAHGAWIVVLLIPLLVHLFFRIHRHYIGLKAKLAVSRLDAFLPPKHHALVLVSSLHGGVVEALSYARLISGDRVEALTVDLGSDGFHDSPALIRLRSDWAHYGMGVPLRSVPSPYRRIVEPVLEEVQRFRLAEPDVCLTVILPEFVTYTWWERLLHGQMALRIKAGLMMKPGVIVTSVRIHLPK
ncbi:MAG: amino acid permease-associated region [Holophagaceae bacterium]|nr:amino acid permease-associated region [Holophagaceae bacterium]